MNFYKVMDYIDAVEDKNEKEAIIRFVDYLSGCYVYFPKRYLEEKEIARKVASLKKMGLKNHEIVRVIHTQNEVSKRLVRKCIKDFNDARRNDPASG